MVVIVTTHIVMVFTVTTAAVIVVIIHRKDVRVTVIAEFWWLLLLQLEGIIRLLQGIFIMVLMVIIAVQKQGACGTRFSTRKRHFLNDVFVFGFVRGLCKGSKVVTLARPFFERKS